MKQWLVLLAIVFSIVAMTAQPGYSAVENENPVPVLTGAGLTIKDVGTISLAFLDDSSQPVGLFRLAREVDLREVDWEQMTQITGIDGADAISTTLRTATQEEEEEEGDEEEGEEAEEGGEEEVDAGWERMWDAPKLG